MLKLQKCVFNSLWISPLDLSLAFSVSFHYSIAYFGGQVYHPSCQIQAKNQEVKLDWVFSFYTKQKTRKLNLIGSSPFLPTFIHLISLIHSISKL